MKQILAYSFLVLSIVASSIPANAKEDPATFNLTAHVKGEGRTRTHGSTSSYNATNGTYSYGTVNSIMHTTEIEIGKLIYTAERECKGVTVGQDYPAKIEGKRVLLLAGDKVCKLRISGTHESQ